MAVADNERIRERIVEVKRDMAARGLHSGGERPFGYDIIRDGKLRRLVPNEAEQRIIACARLVSMATAFERSVAGRLRNSRSFQRERIVRCGLKVV